MPSGVSDVVCVQWGEWSAHVWATVCERLGRLCVAVCKSKMTLTSLPSSTSLHVRKKGP